MKDSDQLLRFFDAFGYLVLPGLMKDEIGWITEEFEAVFANRNTDHDGSQRSCLVPFIDQSERLCTLLDHPKLRAVACALLGEDFNYVSGDGNYYVGDTAWHSDGFHSAGLHVKVAFYLDPVSRDSGCLRVIPGTHRVQDVPAFKRTGTDYDPDAVARAVYGASSWKARDAARSEELWGISGRDVPAMPLESEPGDVVIFNHNLMHASFGGTSRRRMFTLNLCRHAETVDEIIDLEAAISQYGRFWIDQMHSDLMRDTASPQRMVHLQQVMEHEGHLPALAAKWREELLEPSRG